MSRTVKTSTPYWATLLVVAALLASCARAASPGTEGSGGTDSAPGQSEPGAPGGSGNGSGGGSEPCGTPVIHGTGPDATVEYTPCPGEEPPVTHPQTVEPTPGMADLHPVAFERAKVGDDGRTVTIDFWSGVEPCSVLDHVDVSYGSAAVTITLYEGHEPDGGQVACPAIAVEKRVVITLDQPLGDRTIVDGATA